MPKKPREMEKIILADGWESTSGFTQTLLPSRKARKGNDPFSL